MLNHFDVFCVSKTLSPMTQMARTEGNEGIINREPVATDEGVKMIPCISGNQIRHRMVRNPGFRFLIDECGLTGKLTRQQLNFLLHGGDRTDKSATENLAQTKTAHSLMPLLAVLGGSLPDQIMAGASYIRHGMMVCEENRSRLAAVMPNGWTLPESKLWPAEHYVGGYQYTRGDVLNSAPDLLPVDDAREGGGSNLMITAGQSVIAGAMFVHDFHLCHSNELELGALLLALETWQADGSTLGGQSQRGHGRLQMRLHVTPDVEIGSCITAYTDHIRSSKEAIAEWMMKAFEMKPTPEKKKKEKAVTTTVAEPAKGEELFP